MEEGKGGLGMIGRCMWSIVKERIGMVMGGVIGNGEKLGPRCGDKGIAVEKVLELGLEGKKGHCSNRPAR